MTITLCLWICKGAFNGQESQHRFAYFSTFFFLSSSHSSELSKLGNFYGNANMSSHLRFDDSKDFAFLGCHLSLLLLPRAKVLCLTAFAISYLKWHVLILASLSCNGMPDWLTPDPRMIETPKWAPYWCLIESAEVPKLACFDVQIIHRRPLTTPALMSTLLAC